MKELTQEFPPVRHGIHIGSIPSTSFILNGKMTGHSRSAAETAEGK